MSETFDNHPKRTGTAENQRAVAPGFVSKLGEVANTAFADASPDDQQAKTLLMGARRLPSGGLDLSAATSVLLEPENSTVVVEGVRDTLGLGKVLVEIAHAGLEETSLQRLNQTLSRLDKPFEQRLALRSVIRQAGIDLTPDGLLELARSYQKEVVKVNEQGPLFHYHQTDFSNLESIIRNGGLLSSNEQKQRGIDRQGGAGSRPDVVQMTRDKYDQDGNIVEVGIKDTSSGVGVAGDVALVFNETIMDDPNYDCIVKYPNVPTAPFSKLRAVVVSDEKSIAHVQEMFAKRGSHAEVVSRASWLSQYNLHES
jgi:hypothetical protein